MPLPLAPLIGGAVAGLGSFFGSLFGANKQDSINQQQQDFAREMYARQRGDNISDWNMQNEYNSPQMQMQRLREAGLNPNLVYGNGSAVHTAGPLRGAEAPKWDPKSVAVNPGAAITGGLQMYQDIRMREAQTDNLKTQNTVMVQDQLLKQAQTNITNLKALREELDLNRGTDLYQYSLDMYKQQVRKMTLDADKSFYDAGNSELDWFYKNDTLQSRIDATNKSPEEVTARIDSIIQNTKNAKLQAEFKELENSLRKNGITSSDPFYFRVIGQLLSKYGVTIK